MNDWPNYFSKTSDENKHRSNDEIVMGIEYFTS